MPFPVILGLVVGSILVVLVLKILFGLLGLIIGNLLWLAIGGAVGYHYGKKSRDG